MVQRTARKRSIVLAVALMVAIPGVAYVRNSAAEETSTGGTTSGSTGRRTTSESTRGTTPLTTQNADTIKQEAESVRKTVADRAQEAREEVNQRVEAAKTRLQDDRLQRCQAQEKAITKIMADIANRGQKQLELFTTIATRVESFYTEKGKKLSNYDSLVADVNAKKQAAQTVVSDIEAADTTFTCTGDNPRGVIDGFKSSLQQEIAALKEYRTSIKNLIAGVKSVQSTEATKTTTGGTR